MSTASAPTVFEGARILVGDGSAAIDNAAILVRDGLIVAIAPAAELQVPADAERVDLSGKTVMPAIVNAHGHIGYLKGSETSKDNFTRENVIDHLHRLAYYGVSVFLSLGTDRDDIEIALRDDQRSGRLNDPELPLLFSAANGLIAPTPGSENGGPFFATDVIQEVSTVEEARATVRETAKKKPDFIKFWVDDRWGTKAKLTPEIYGAIIDEAHQLGIRVIAHIYELDEAKDVVRAGVDGLAHMVREPGPDDEFIELLKANDVFDFTTMSIQQAVPAGSGWLQDPSLAETVSPEARSTVAGRLDGVPEEARQRMAASYAILEDGLRKLVENDVRVVMSPDTGVYWQFHGYAEHREMEAMVTAGMSANAVISASTQIPAEILGLRDRGTLEVGKRADLLVLDGNPLDDITNTRKIAAVYFAGHALDRDALRSRWTGAALQA